MKAEELRIGNWVASKRHNGLNTEIFSILDSKHVRLGANPMATYKVEEIEGLPLTEEWLLKFGMCVYYNSEWQNKYEIPLSACISATVRYKQFNGEDRTTIEVYHYDTNIECLTVHHFQNIVHSLTGTELTLNQ